MKVALLGCGYVGLTTAACLAEIGHNVICYDIDNNKLNNIKKGDIGIYEPNLAEIVLKNIEEKRLKFTTSISFVFENIDVCFIAVGTPPKKNGEADTRHVLEAGKTIAKNIKKYTVIVNKSTVPIGFHKILKDEIKKNTDIDFDIVSNPEFLSQGTAVKNFLNPDRIIIGASSDKAIKTMEELYKPLNCDDKILKMNEQSAELTKYAANSFLALKISYINEIARLCELYDADIKKIQKGMSLDPRIGDKFLNSGLGFGGSCFPKDTKAIVEFAKKNKYDFKTIKAAIDINDEQINLFAKKILKFYKNKIKNKVFAFWGLAFKPNTNDLREAPSIKIANILAKYGAKIIAYDPKAKVDSKNITQLNSKKEAIFMADALVILTEWDEFKNVDFETISKALKDKVIFDGRNIYQDISFEKYNLKYISVGRKFNYE